MESLRAQLVIEILTQEYGATRMIQEQPFIVAEPERRSTLFRSWGSDPVLESQDELPDGENQPLLPRSEKKKKKMFGLFRKRTSSRD